MMDFLDRLRGRNDAPDETRVAQGPRYPAGGDTPRQMTDEEALERYRYMLRTAPPEDIERAHEEAFAALTPEQRALALRELAAYAPESERRMASDDPKSLARMATRAEIRQPGTIERAFGGGGPGVGGRPGAGGGWGGPGLGSIFLTSLAAGFVGSAIAQSFFADHGGFESGYSEGYQDAAATGESGGEQGHGGDTGAADHGGGDASGGDFGGGDFGGGDFGGGDFGGGDFGGGDFGGGDFGGI